MRSLLLVPTEDDSRLDRAVAAGADMLILDIADSGDGQLRDAAARMAKHPDVAIHVRVGPIAGGRTVAELNAIMPARPAGVVLTGAHGGADVTRLAALLRPREAMAGVADGATTIVVMATDTPESLLSMASYRGATRRLAALAWDSAALAAIIDARDLDQTAQMARSLALVAAAAAGVPAIDRPYRGGDLTALEAEARTARDNGFAGKLTRDPAHVAVLNAVFSRPASSR